MQIVNNKNMKYILNFINIAAILIISVSHSLLFVQNKEVKNDYLSLNYLELNIMAIASEESNCLADDPGECVATATCPGGTLSVCCTGNSPDCESGNSAFSDDVWVECNNGGKNYAYC